MSDRRRQILRIFIAVVIAHILAGFQASFWHHIFGSLTPPALWLMLFVYLTLYRETMEALVTLFLVSFAGSVYTSLPEGLLTLNLLGLFTAVRFVKSRVFVPTSLYFATLMSGAVMMFFVVHLLLSLIFENTPVVDPALMATVFQVILTFVFALPLFTIFRWIDRLIRDDTKETWGVIGE